MLKPDEIRKGSYLSGTILNQIAEIIDTIWHRFYLYRQPFSNESHKFTNEQIFHRMKISKYFLIIAILVMGTSAMNAQNKVKNTILPGSWMGKLSSGGMELRVIFNLKLVQKDSLIVTLDSPDQNAKDIPVGPVVVENQKVCIKAPGINGQYDGKVMNDSTITGTWSQNGGTFPLDIKKQKKL
jgi:hypothetical protein